MDTQEEPMIFLFGLSEPRKFFYGDLLDGKIPTEKDVFKDSRCVHDHLIDTYIEGLRETMKQRAKMLMDPVKRKLFFKDWINYLLPEIKDLPLWPRYFKFSRENEKNRLEKPYEQVEVVAYSPNMHKFHKNGERIEPCGHTKRGCKIGIDIVKTRPNTKIYFTLDDLDKRAVIDKEYGKGDYFSLTSSELRYIYRDWKVLKNKVVFFENNKRTRPPWKEPLYKLRWKNYAAGRLHKRGEVKGTDSMESTSINKERASEVQSLDSLKANAYKKMDESQEIARKNHALRSSSKSVERTI
ncbi:MULTISPECIES: hypothetical protein [unclassified Enterococcus]|uniref:hypothetical protein n=1 Tax=unclassified Enterococcus TaxID=2608891 RepID=UPI001A9AC5C6|nr:hypothetical protein [Enterococcus sp. DIV1271a]MBO1298669.1 hypothetical protein [Enterococcus sp. DIV1271a]